MINVGNMIGCGIAFKKKDDPKGSARCGTIRGGGTDANHEPYLFVEAEKTRDLLVVNVQENRITFDWKEE